MNSNMTLCDVLVVGGGPAGACAAFASAKAGAQTRLLECRGPNGASKCCGEFYPGSDINGEEPDPSWLFCRVKESRTWFGSLSFEARTTGMFLDRSIWEPWLRNRAASIGVEISYYSTFLDFLEPGVARLIGPQGETHVRFRCLIGADGCNSQVRESLGLAPVPRQIGLMVELPPSGEPGGMEFRLDPHGMGYAWLFRKTRDTSLGIVGPLGHVTLHRIEEAASSFAIHLPPNIRASARPIPTWDQETSIGLNNVLLVGDAAGQVDPLTFGGLRTACIAGHKAGMLAALAASPLDSYQEWADTRLAPFFQASKTWAEKLGNGTNWDKDNIIREWPPLRETGRKWI